MPTPTLKETQVWMKSRIAQGDGGAAAVLFNPQGSDPGEKRLEVYKEGYEVRLREALAETFEAVKFVVGDSLFAELTRAYCKKYPSHDTNLNFVGRHLPEFIQSFDAAQKLPFLSDLAQLEWRVSQAFHAFERTAITAGDLAAFPAQDWPNAKIIFQPSVSVLSSPWPILDIWEARHSSRDKVNVDLSDTSLRPIVIGRVKTQVRCRVVEAWQFDLMQSLLAGFSLEEALECISEELQDFSLITAWFSGLVADGLIVQISSRNFSR